MKYICKKSWARNSEGDIIEEYEYIRLPHEMRQRFTEYHEPKVLKKETTKPEPIPEVVEEVKKEEQPLVFSETESIEVEQPKPVQSPYAGSFRKKEKKED